ncbi:hypothetical protein KI387_040117, partial [Taxus chinensis]
YFPSFSQTFILCCYNNESFAFVEDDHVELFSKGTKVVEGRVYPSRKTLHCKDVGRGFVVVSVNIVLDGRVKFPFLVDEFETLVDVRNKGYYISWEESEVSKHADSSIPPNLGRENIFSGSEDYNVESDGYCSDDTESTINTSPKDRRYFVTENVILKHKCCSRDDDMAMGFITHVLEDHKINGERLGPLNFGVWIENV